MKSDKLKIFPPNKKRMKNLKLALVGDTGVGKTQLIRNLKQSQEKLNPTIGADFNEIDFQGTSKKCHFEIWDTAGQEKYSSLLPMYLRNKDVYLLVYDITLLSSFEHLDNWIYEIRSYGTKNAPIILIGNKLDLGESRQISYDNAISKSVLFRTTIYRECSAKTGENVMSIFSYICDEVGIETDLSKNMINQSSSINIDAKNSKKGCC